MSYMCSIDRCPGSYEEREILHTVRYQGQPIVFDHVPAELCTVCGDVLLRPETIRRLETLLSMRAQPARTIPLYEFA